MEVGFKNCKCLFFIKFLSFKIDARKELQIKQLLRKESKERGIEFHSQLFLG